MPDSWVLFGHCRALTLAREAELSWIFRLRSPPEDLKTAQSCCVTVIGLTKAGNPSTHRPLSSSVLGLPYRILNINHKKELLRGLWVTSKC